MVRGKDKEAICQGVWVVLDKKGKEELGNGDYPAVQ
jgi:hypothetical protein